MKFSSISLVAAALAAIAGSTTAVPVPLYAPTLERVNSLQQRDLLDLHRRESGVAPLERDVDGELLDSLVTRSNSNNAQMRHVDNVHTRHELRGAASVSRQAAALTREVKELEPERSQFLLEDTIKTHEADAKMLTEKFHQHLRKHQHSYEENTELLELAKKKTAKGADTCRLALKRMDVQTQKRGQVMHL